MELLAPAGGWDALVAAIENGADAVYIGGRDFSARQGAENFDREEIARAIEFAHIRERKIYVAVNTLIDDSEFNQALDYIHELYQLAVDAVIVQDLGLLYALRKVMPALPVHASTQMTIHNVSGVKYLQELGVKRAVLARELSGEEIRQIKQAVPTLELEIFVHGALCFSYSGQCLFSSMVGGRSGNRGRCAQACRLPYELYSSRSAVPVQRQDGGRYVLSPADLCLIEYLADIRDRGITSLKIEGRMKRPEYVAVVTRSYREALDSLEQNHPRRDFDKLKRDMLQVFNRNFSSGYYRSERRGFLSSKRPNHRGVYVGRVLQQEQSGLTQLKLSEQLGLEDGIEVWVARGKNPVAYVRDMKAGGRSVSNAARGDVVELNIQGRAAAGDRVFKIYDASLLGNAARSAREYSSGKIEVDAEVVMSPGEAAQITFRDKRGNQAQVFSQSPAQVAEKHGLDEAHLRDKLGRLGNTPFTLANLTLISSGELMIPLSELNDARRRAVEQLRAAYLKPYQYPALKKNYREFYPQYVPSPAKPKKNAIHDAACLSIMVSGVDEARAAMDAGADRIYIGLEGLGQARPASIKSLADLTNQARSRECEIIPSLPRIQKTGEEKEWEGLLQLSCDTIMVGNLGSLKWARDRKLSVRADYSLNVFNNITLNYLLNIGAQSVCLSPELNFKQLQDLRPLDKAEVLVQGELILMLSQFCILRALLGNEEGKCPAYCRQDDYRIRDDKGYEFPLMGDSDCRFYLFNSRTLCLLDDLEKVLALGIGSIRIEARRQTAPQVGGIVAVYRQALNELRAGIKPDYNRLKSQLLELSPSEFTKCHYYRGVL